MYRFTYPYRLGDAVLKEFAVRIEPIVEDGRVMQFGRLEFLADEPSKWVQGNPHLAGKVLAWLQQHRQEHEEAILLSAMSEAA